MSRTHIFVVGLLLMIALCGVASAAIVSPLVDHGNGVLSFWNIAPMGSLSFGDSYQGFGDALSQYLFEHPEKHVVLIAPEGSNDYGLTRQFYVIVENKTPMKFIPTWNGGSQGSPAYVEVFQ